MGQKKKFNCSAFVPEASADPIEDSGAEVALQNCPKLREGAGPQYFI